jgi:hypothetical protein
LHASGLVPFIVVSGGSRAVPDGSQFPTEADAIADVLLRRDIPKDAIALKQLASNTSENFWLAGEALRLESYAATGLIDLGEPVPVGILSAAINARPCAQAAAFPRKRLAQLRGAFPRSGSTSAASNRYADRVTSKKRRSGRGNKGNKGPRQGISGNPQRRAVQLAERRPTVADEPEPLVLDFRSEQPEDSMFRELAYALAGGAEPRPWWSESHERILAAARALDWPPRPVDLETHACRIVGDEFYKWLNSRVSGLHPTQWLRALAEETGAALRASVADGTDDWRQLWALLRGLALTAPPGGRESETAELAREHFPDIKDAYEAALAEAGRAAKLLASRRLAPGVGHPADGCRAAGEPLVARDAYGSRFLLVAPFGYDGEAPDHWYAWDIDWCWIDTVVGAGVFGAPEDALTEWRDAVGQAAAGAALSPSTPEVTAQLLARCLETGPLSDMMQGSEPLELIREYYRLRRRARVLVGPASAKAASAAVADADADAAEDSPARDDPGPVREAFLRWYAARHEDVPQDTADAVDTIIAEWGPRADPGDSSLYACSPHRIEMAAHLIREGYYPDYANAALRLLPDWTQWCIEQSEIDGDFAARSRGTALTESAAVVDEETHGSAPERDNPPFRRQE